MFRSRRHQRLPTTGLIAAAFAGEFRRRRFGRDLIADPSARSLATLLSAAGTTVGFNGDRLSFELLGSTSRCYGVMASIITLFFVVGSVCLRCCRLALRQAAGASRDGSNGCASWAMTRPLQGRRFTVAAVMSGSRGNVTLHAGVVRPRWSASFLDRDGDLGAIGGRHLSDGRDRRHFAGQLRKDRSRPRCPSCGSTRVGLLFIIARDCLAQGIVGEFDADPLQASKFGDMFARWRAGGPPHDRSTDHVALENVTVDFDGFRRSTICLEHPVGHMTVVIGRMVPGNQMCDTIIGRCSPDAGLVLFHGEEIHAVGAQIVGKGICRKFQTPGVLISLSVIDNLTIAADRRSALVEEFRQDRDRGSPRQGRGGPRQGRLVGTSARDCRNLSHGEKQWLRSAIGGQRPMRTAAAR